MAAAALGIAIAGALAALAVGLHRTTHATWVIALLLGITLAALAWRGGAARRGSLAGVLAGLPPMLAPVLLFALGHGGHCPDCQLAPTLTCLLTCFGTSALVGTLVGHVAAHDAAPARYALAAIATAALTGLLGCSTTGLGGAVGVVVGLVAGGVTGWVVAGRTAAA
ncbi:MAG TPA: hypothetical protein VGF94_12445 [Kofleriaceae bacterium]